MDFEAKSIKVYHTNGLFEEMTLVARVNTDSLDAAFELTNHIEGSWEDNEKVHPATADSQRSTSVGDIMVDEADGGV